MSRVLVGYDECRCILSQYCDGECRPVFADRSSRYGAAPTQGADARPVVMPNLDGDWSPISETLVHRLRDPIPAHALADMPERMAEAINVIREEAAHAIESLCGQFRELEYIMECSKNAKAAATLNLNLESGLGDGGLLDANIEAARAAPSDAQPVADMRMLIQRLAHSLRRAEPDNALCNQAMDYLKRTAPTGSMLRDGDQS
jgi:hypothetical protein